MNNYETVFILNPVLSEDQAKDAVEKFAKVLTKSKADIINVEQWGLKRMAYPIHPEQVYRFLQPHRICGSSRDHSDPGNRIQEG